MKKMRKGFTLVELLIVIAILGTMSAMMATSSTDAIDSSTASAILNNLQTMKAAAFQMYMYDPEIASLGKFALDNASVTNEEGYTPDEILASSYLGKATLGAKYGLIASASSWYVVYTMDAEDNLIVRSKLAARAAEAGLYGTTTKPSEAADNCGFSVDYAGTEAAGATVYIALKVR